jgi:hypothetical protein
MPWYTNPTLTCKVLNRIANRYPRATLKDLKTTLDNATQLIWSKQEHYYKNIPVHANTDLVSTFSRGQEGATMLGDYNQ